MLNLLLVAGLLYSLLRNPLQSKGILDNISKILKKFSKVDKKDLETFYALEKRIAGVGNGGISKELESEVVKVHKKILTKKIRILNEEKKTFAEISKSFERMSEKIGKLQINSAEFKGINKELSEKLLKIAQFINKLTSDQLNDAIKILLKDIKNSPEAKFYDLVNAFYLKDIKEMLGIKPEDEDPSKNHSSGGEAKAINSSLTSQEWIYISEEALEISQIFENELK